MLLLSKFLLVPIIIALISLAGRIWGPRISGMLGGLPIIAGPIVVFLTLDNGVEFGLASARAALGGVISLALFCYAYAWVSKNHEMPASMLAGLSAFFVFTAVGMHIALPVTIYFPLVLLLLTAIVCIFPEHTPNVEAPSVGGASLGGAAVPSNEIAFRMLAAASLVLLLTLSSTILGPALSGLLAPFPIAGSILAGFTHRGSGAGAARYLLFGFTQGLFGMAGFFFAFALCLPDFGVVVTLIFAITFTLAVGKTVHGFSRFRELRKAVIIEQPSTF